MILPGSHGALPLDVLCTRPQDSLICKIETKIRVFLQFLELWKKIQQVVIVPMLIVAVEKFEMS